MKRRKKREVEHKITDAKRLKRITIYGLILGLSFIFLGILGELPPLLIVGYGSFVICTGIFSFLTVLNWLSVKPLERENNKETDRRPSLRSCPRCGAKMKIDVDYCRRCGKKMQTKR